MADRAKYAVAVTPIETLTDDNAGEHDVIAGEIGRSLGGNGVALVTNFNGAASDQGFLNQAANYKSADKTTAAAISTESSGCLVFIKNTGKVFSSATALGAVGTESVAVYVSTVLISILDPCEAIVLKDDNGGIDASGITVKTVSNTGTAGSVNMAVEYLVLA